MLEYDGKKLITPQDRCELLKYWIEERENIRALKEANHPKPWTRDPIFRDVYFCNVRREQDKTTKWIRNFYNPWVMHDNFELNIVLARLLNWPATLQRIGFWDTDERSFTDLNNILDGMAGKVFGNAYIVSTNGNSVPKAQYLCRVLLPGAHEVLNALWRKSYGCGSLGQAYTSIIRIHGMGSFMAGQVIADLKNTRGHPLTQADDWWTFVVPGPGSIRGVNWIMNGNPDRRGFENFTAAVETIRYMLEKERCEGIETICNQDLQNCLCEFDKYCRVLTGTGKSKRGYDGR
jgi:hypothetical protein